MATQNVTFDGSTQINAFGRTYDWDDRYLESLHFENDGSITNDTLNISLSGAVWRIRRLSLDSQAQNARLDVNITDADDGVQRRIDWLQLGDYSNTTVTLFGSRIRFIDGGESANTTLNLGSSSVNNASLGGFVNTVTFGDGSAEYLELFGDTNTVTAGSGSIRWLQMGNGTNTFTGGSGWLAFLEMGEGTNTFTGGTGGFGAIRAFGTNTMTFESGGDSVVFGSGDTSITLNGGFFGSITGYGEDYSVNTIIVGSDADVRSIGVSNGKDRLTINGNVEQIQTGGNDDRVIVGSGGEIEVLNLGSGNNFFRTNGNNVWVVNAFGENDIFEFRAGATDQAYAGGGNNVITLSGGYSLGTLRTNEGDDRLTVNGDSDVGVVRLGEGNNTVTVNNGRMNSLVMFEGNDTVTVNADGEIDSVDLGEGNNTLVVNGGQVNSVLANGNETISLLGEARILMLKMDRGVNVLTTEDGNIESIYAFAARNTLTLGTGGAQQIVFSGSPEAQRIESEGWIGSLQIFAGNQTDVQATTVTLGVEGAGYIQTSRGNDVITTGAGEVQSIFTWDGNDKVVVGSGGAVVVSTGIGSDVVDARGGRIETLDTGDGDDTVTLGGKMARLVNLGIGDDMLVLNSGENFSFVEVQGGHGIDTLDMSGISAALVLSLGNSAWQDIGDPSLHGYVGIIQIERLVSGGLADSLAGNDSDNLLSANAGNDSLSGLDGNDTLIGGTGNDMLTGGLGDDSLVGGSGIDTAVFTGTAAVVVNLYSGGPQDTGHGLDTILQVENVTGGQGHDRLRGNGQANVLEGGSGNDQLNGDLGNDLLFGGAGRDSFVFATAPGAANLDTIADFDPVFDTIRIDNAVFAGLAGGALAAAAFTTNPTGQASASAHRIIYDIDTGELYFDADGNGAGGRVQFAQLAPILPLSAADFLVV